MLFMYLRFGRRLTVVALHGEGNFPILYLHNAYDTVGGLDGWERWGRSEGFTAR